MPSPAYLNTSLWTPGVARLVSVGGIDISKGGKAECKDKYAFILSPGTRPVMRGTGANVSGLPDYGDPNPSNDALSVSSISFSQAGDHSPVWEATVTYSGGENDSIGDEDEELENVRYTRVHIGTVSENRELTVDADNANVDVVNSAGDPFESVPQVERHLVEIQITRSQNFVPDMSLNGTVNSAALTVAGISIAQKCGRISIEADRNFGGFYAWSVTFRIVINPATWNLVVLDNGYRYKDNGQLVKFTETTSDGRIVECSTPKMLDGTGGAASPTAPEPYYLTFAAYPSASWASLHLPPGDSFGEPSSNSSESETEP